MYRGYYLGCPIWGNKDWVGELFSEDARQKDFLRQYASAFNTVEGFVGHPEVDENLGLLGEWASAVAGWMREGKIPYIFMHAPDGKRDNR